MLLHLQSLCGFLSSIGCNDVGSELLLGGFTQTHMLPQT